MRKLFIALLTLSALAVTAAPAHAHARLISSNPAGGSTLTEEPPEVVLEFSERIEASFGGVQVFDPAGTRLEAGEPQIDGDTVRVALPALAGPGDYTVAFRIVSGDSHPVEARFAFSFQPQAPAPLPVVPPTGPPTGPQPLEVDIQDAGPLSTGGLWLARLLNYLAMTAVVGLLLAGTFLLSGDAERKRAFAAAERFSLLWALSGIALFIFGLSVAAALPLTEAVQGQLPARFAGTRFGLAVLVQAALATIAAAAVFLAGRRRGKGAWAACLIIVGLALLAPGYWGHAGTSENPLVAVTSDWAHLAAVTAWVGGLAVLALFVLRPGSSISITEPSQRFSKVAGISLVVVLVTGTINALTRIGTVDELLSTEWGRLVLIKLVLFGVIVALGYRNRKRMLPAIAKDPDTGRSAFRKMAMVEIGVMLASFAAATALASTIPADAEAASRLQSIVTRFARGQINLTVEPATVGDNLMHLYFLDSTGQPLVVSDPSLTLGQSGSVLEARLFESGPGHYTVLSQRIDAPGAYSVTVSAQLDGENQTSTGTIAVR